MRLCLKNIILFGLTLCTLLLKAQDTITINPLKFNTNEREFAPIYYKNGLVFCGINTNNEALTYLDHESGKQMTDLFFAPLVNNIFGERILFNTQLQTSFHDGPITFSIDGKTAYFTRSRIIEKKLKNKIEQENNLGVFKATFNGTTWENITPCSFNSEVYNVGQPSISKDGTKLFVVSDKEGGYGGKDIYYIDINKDTLGELINMGANINSQHNEMFPFISSSNNLYFSSDKPGGMGGLDVYSYNLNKEKAIAILLKDTAINTPFDDFSLVLNEAEDEGYFSSNRLGSDDIFKINIVFPAFANCEEMKKEQLCYEFFEEATLNADSVAMLYQWDFGDGSKEENLEVYHCYEKPGFYLVNLNIMDPVIDKIFVNQDTYELEIEEVIQPYFDVPDTVLINENFIVKIEQGTWVKYNIDNFYINYGDSSIFKNNLKPHNYNKEGEYEIQIMIAGIDSNTNELRTNCFYKTLIVKDSLSDIIIEKNEIEQLQADNFNIEELTEIDDDLFYALELLSTKNSVISDSIIFKAFANTIREYFNEDNQEFEYLIGKTSYPFELIDKFRLSHQLGFENATVKSYNHIDSSIIIDDLGDVEIDSEGYTNVTLKEIFFNYESFELTNSSKNQLKKVAEFLAKKTYKIEIGAYTDNKGADSYNLSLSDKRAASVKQYLMEQRIDKNRLKSKGYGETKPIAPNQLPNGDDNPSGRAKNRRVTFKIL